MTRHRVYAPIACPYVLSVRDPYAREPAGRWRPLGEFPDAPAARAAGKSLRRFWPWVAVRITYPPVGD